MKKLLENKFITNLGDIVTYIETNSNKIIPIDKNCIYTSGHKVSIETFTLSNELIPKGMNFESSVGYRWFVEKINDIPETFKIFCKLINTKKGVEFSGDAGERLPRGQGGARGRRSGPDRARRG